MGLVRILIFIVVGLVVIILSGNYLVSNAIKLSKITNIPEVMIGATVVSLATTLPELSVTIFSSIENANSMAVGNAIGSMVFNLTFIIGLSVLFMPQKIKVSSFSKNFKFLIACLVLLFFIGAFNCMNYFYGILLLLMCGYYLTENFYNAKHHVYSEMVVVTEKVAYSKKDMFLTTLKLICSSLFVLLGAKLLIEGCVDFAYGLNVSHHIVGVSIVAVGTSLPELVTAFSSIRKKSTSIAIGNIIGANILSCTLLMGASGVFNKGVLSFDSNITFFAIPLCFIALMIIYLPIRKKSETNRLQGVLLIALSIIYYLISFGNIWNRLLINYKKERLWKNYF